MAGERHALVRAHRKPGGELGKSGNHAVERIVEDPDHALAGDSNRWQGGLHRSVDNEVFSSDGHTTAAVVEHAPDGEAIVAAGVAVPVDIVKVAGTGIDRSM